MEPDVPPPEQAPNQDNNTVHMEPAIPPKIQVTQKTGGTANVTQPQMETPKSPAKSLVYKTPPSSPQTDLRLGRRRYQSIKRNPIASDFFRRGEVR